MTIEEKAKAYDEAIERAKNFIENGDEGERTVAESIFAGLMEVSEDEKIRKELLNAFQESEDSLYMLLTPHRRESFIAWLEKQGEQKPAWSEEDEEMYKRVETAIDSYYAPFSRDAEEMSEWFKSLKERCTWKPSDEQMEGLKEVIKFLGCTKTRREQLQSLYDDLKKLREK